MWWRILPTWELRPTFVGLVDDTGMGQDVIDKLARHKVNTRFIQKKPDGMGTWLAIFDNDGDVHAAISKRPDTHPADRPAAGAGRRDLCRLRFHCAGTGPRKKKR